MAYHKSLTKFLVIIAVSFFLLSYFSLTQTSSVKTGNLLVAEPMHIIELSDPSGFSGYSPSQIRAAYGLPSTGGNGTTIAIIDAYYTPTILNDLTLFSENFGLPIPNSGNFKVYNMSARIGTATTGWATETSLDVEWAHAIAPDATILLVEASNDELSSLNLAISYAASQPNVVAVSMSWGASEFSSESQYDSLFTSNHGVVFFASSGDNGSSSGLNWPACSPNVVAVGGTTLNLLPNGTVSSETAWNGSGGGISRYEAMPTYQISFGLNTILNTTNRAVPDVSYDANPSTGVKICVNSNWEVVGGTSVGAPQWAAIQADAVCASNSNFYSDAKSAYSSYFRDITSGSNGLYNASQGYDLVTGLGSPLTDNFTYSSIAASPSPTPTPTMTTSPIPTSPTSSPAPSSSPTPNPTTSPSPSQSPTPTLGPTTSPVSSPTPTSTLTPPDAPAPTPNPTITPTPVSSTPNPTATPTATPLRTGSPVPISSHPPSKGSSGNVQVSDSSVAPESPIAFIIMVFVLLVAMTLTLVTIKIRNRNQTV